MLSAVSSPPPSFVNPRASRLCPSTLNVLSSPLQKLPKINFRFNCARDSGENESKTIMDAFFLGKAVGEAISERIESAVGEFLSTIGRLQAEQQKQGRCRGRLELEQQATLAYAIDRRIEPGGDDDLKLYNVADGGDFRGGQGSNHNQQYLGVVSWR
ncbi:Uncharacterized protein - chloroplastic [Striga hermonthica]|uniref:Uncharacterized protein - chloroplastic n=1 Tax=Striga hermonthica TaxID=68872 RepID=A0A9N7NEV3_STRHE|nr:Uncharacterized protein - chloroplastic [Striga hermonthica]